MSVNQPQGCYDSRGAHTHACRLLPAVARCGRDEGVPTLSWPYVRSYTSARPGQSYVVTRPKTPRHATRAFLSARGRTYSVYYSARAKEKDAVSHASVWRASRGAPR